MSTTSKSKDGRHLRRADNRQRIYEAALALLDTRSFNDLSIDDICKEAGVGRATYFRIYKTKPGLLLEFNRRLTVRAKLRLKELGKASAKESLFVVGEEIATAWNEVSPTAASIAVEFVGNLTLANLHEAHPDLLQLVISIVKRGITSGEIRAVFPPDFLGSLALFYISAAALLWFEDTEQDLSLFMQEAIDSWLNGAGHNEVDILKISSSARADGNI